MVTVRSSRSRVGFLGIPLSNVSVLEGDSRFFIKFPLLPDRGLYPLSGCKLPMSKPVVPYQVTLHAAWHTPQRGALLPVGTW